MMSFLLKQNFLIFSSDNVKEFIEEIRSEINKETSQREIVNKILKVINEKIDIDENMLEDVNAEMLRASSVFRRGKGVCQNFAVAFVAIARGLGIPARVVVGMHLSSHQGLLNLKYKVEAGPHAWVEILLNSSLEDNGKVKRSWHPIEPQREKLNPYIGGDYFPITVLDHDLYKEKTTLKSLFKIVTLMSNIALSPNVGKLITSN